MTGNKVGVFHLGDIHIAFRSFFEGIGCELIVPDPINKETVKTGFMHSPEGVCLPFKIMLGNYINALDRGAQTLFFITGHSPRSCRLADYGIMFEQILTDMGYTFDVFCVDGANIFDTFTKLKDLSPDVTIAQIVSSFNLAFRKMMALEKLDGWTKWYQATERERGSVSKLYKAMIRRIDEASDTRQVKDILEDAEGQYENIPRDPLRRTVKIALIGDFYTLSTPFINMDLAQTLGKHGAHVTQGIYFGDIVRDIFKIGPWGDRSFSQRDRLAKPYISHPVGGFGSSTIGDAVYFAQHGYDGLIEVHPFNCTPEIVASSLLGNVSKDHDINHMVLTFDGHTSQTGLNTRLEAFVDILTKKRELA